MHARGKWIGLAGAALALLLWAPAASAGSGGGGSGGPCAGFGGGARLILRDNCFDAVAHFVPAGSTVVVRNDGDLPHTLTAVDGSFDTGQLEGGEQAEIEVGSGGSIRVYCTLHGTAAGNGMAGVLVVEPAAGSAERGTGAGPLALSAAGAGTLGLLLGAAVMGTRRAGLFQRKGGGPADHAG